MEQQKQKNNWFLILFGGVGLIYAIGNLAAPLFIQGAGIEIHVWNLELRGTPAVIVGLGYAALGLVLVLSGLRGKKEL